jgi:hypothetical protein
MANANVKTNNGTINNNTSNGGKTMKNDYTLNGKLTATTWQEFRKAMKEAGIETGTKSYSQLVQEYNSLNSEDANKTEYYNNMAKQAQVSQVKTKSQYNEERWDAIAQSAGLELSKTKKVTVDAEKDKDKLETILKDIIKSSFTANQGDSKGLKILPMKKLYGIIKRAYVGKDNNLDEDSIKKVINILVFNKYIKYKKYESGAMIFYPTTSAADYVSNLRRKDKQNEKVQSNRSSQ